MPDRYVVDAESHSGHDCCFEASVFDTRPDETGIWEDKREPICDCYSLEDAQMICAALNEKEKSNANEH